MHENHLYKRTDNRFRLYYGPRRRLHRTAPLRRRSAPLGPRSRNKWKLARSNVIRIGIRSSLHLWFRRTNIKVSGLWLRATVAVYGGQTDGKVSWFRIARQTPCLQPLICNNIKMSKLANIWCTRSIRDIRFVNRKCADFPERWLITSFWSIHNCLARSRDAVALTDGINGWRNII